MEIRFDVVHRTGVEQQTAAFSRLHTNGTNMAHLKDDFPVVFINILSHDKHGCPSHVLEDVSNILMFLNPEQKKTQSDHLDVIYKSPRGGFHCHQAADQISQSGTKF